METAATRYSTPTLIEWDRSHVWHPFTQAAAGRDPIPIVKAKGCHLYAADGSRYLDGISSWWVNLHGHAHPYIAEKIKIQAETLEHVIFADFTHPPAIDLAARLISLLPGNMGKIFYSDNGSTAVEAALKIAFQYWHNKSPSTTKTKVICFKGSYHGDTFGAMSASGKNNFNRPFWSHLFDVEMIDPPLNGLEKQSLKQLKSILRKEQSACFIFEPLILGVGGMKIYPAAGLDSLLQACWEHDVLTIADEVMTGFGRTDTLFACDQLKNKPDMICLSKGLTGGFLPLGVTACREHIYEAFLSNEVSQAFLHGHSYTANPIACSSALASLDLLLDDSCAAQREAIAASHSRFVSTWRWHPRLKRCESIGTILAIEYQTGEADSYFNSIGERLYSYFLQNRILLRPLGNVLYVLPPYCITMDELQLIYLHLIISFKDTP